MNFASIPKGESVFLDANTLVYHFSAHAMFGPACVALLDRIERQELPGITSSHILGEMAHKLMTIEAQQRFGWVAAGLANRLKRHPNEVMQLAAHQRALDEVRAIGIHVLPVEGADISRAADISRQFGLLANDALTVGIMSRHKLTYLASSDADFDRVPALTRCAPV